MIEPKDVTIIIPHYGNSGEAEYSLDRCLESLKETWSGKIILAVNGGNCTWHTDYDEQFSLIRVQEQGQCKATNAAVATTNTPYILITNDDMIFPSGWFEKLVTDLPVKEGSPICVSPKLIEPRPGAPTFETYFCGGAGGDFDKEKFLAYANLIRESETRTGFNFPVLMSRSLWDTVGGYDINFDPWGSNSDSDLEYKIKLAGVQPLQKMDSVVYHFSQTSGTFTPENRSHWERNFAYFAEKWGFPRTDAGIWEASFDIPKPPLRIFTPEWEGKYAQ